LISQSVIIAPWTIARSMWLAQRPRFLALLCAAVVCGWFFHLVPLASQKSDGMDLLAYLPMGLSIFLTFVFCNFTESDRRGRFDGFPSRLFALPISTRTLLIAPMLFSVFIVGAVYSAWAALALPALGRSLPLGWPLLYLANGMICFQAVVWSLARFRVARIIALGVGGTLLAFGWIVLCKGVERFFLIGLIPETISVRTIGFGLLGLMSLGALTVANIAVENQRRGGIRPWRVWRNSDANQPQPATSSQRTLLERFIDALHRWHKPFKSVGAAQFWFEWRRHGSLLPLATGCVLLIIMAPAPFFAPIGAERAGILLIWIVALPLLLAFVLGKGFGKADLWSKEEGIPLFLATRPLSIRDWIGAKLKAAAMATATAWLLVLVLTPFWLRFWCDYQPMLDDLKKTSGAYPGFSIGSGVALFLLCVLLTWRFLIGSLYLGLSGKAWMINTAACGVFLSIFAVPLGISVIAENHAYLLLYPPAWVPWVIAALFAAKVSGSAALARHAYRHQLITTRSMLIYGTIWLGVAILLVVIGFKLVPFEITRAAGWSRWTFALLILFAVPLLRVAAAPIALARNRRR
jgi:hypothetical protein